MVSTAQALIKEVELSYVDLTNLVKSVRFEVTEEDEGKTDKEIAHWVRELVKSHMRDKSVKGVMPIHTFENKEGFRSTGIITEVYVDEITLEDDIYVVTLNYELHSTEGVYNIFSASQLISEEDFSSNCVSHLKKLFGEGNYEVDYEEIIANELAHVIQKLGYGDGDVEVDIIEHSDGRVKVYMSCRMEKELPTGQFSMTFGDSVYMYPKYIEYITSDDIALVVFKFRKELYKIAEERELWLKQA